MCERRTLGIITQEGLCPLKVVNERKGQTDPLGILYGTTRFGYIPGDPVACGDNTIASYYKVVLFLSNASRYIKHNNTGDSAWARPGSTGKSFALLQV